MSNFKSTSFENSSMPDPIKSIVRQGRPKADNPKIPVSIRLSPEVVEHFKSTGRGWQTRMDEVLKEYVAVH